jgi:hypothetical protein
MDMVRHNHISPILMEALQMLKFGLHLEPFNFISHLLTPKADLILAMGAAPDMLADLVKAGVGPSCKDVMDKIIREIEA